MKFKAILFDYFGVVSSDEIWDFVHVEKQAEDEFHELAEEVNLGHMGWQEYCKAVAEKSGNSVDAVNDVYDKHSLNKQLLTLIKGLGTKYKTALVTNASSEYIEPIAEETHLGELFDEFVVSSEVGVVKPDPKIYQAACKKLRVEPKDCVFIDDIQKNVTGAREAGMQGLLFKDTKTLKEELRELGVL